MMFIRLIYSKKHSCVENQKREDVVLMSEKELGLVLHY